MIERADYEAILNAVPDGITVQDRSGKLVYWNEFAAKVLGFSTVGEASSDNAGQVIKRFEIFDEAGRPMDPSKLPGRQVINGKSADPMVLRFHIKETKREYWSLVKAAAFRNPDGSLKYVVNIFQDITQLKEAELSLAEANQRITKILEGVIETVGN